MSRHTPGPWIASIEHLEEYGVVSTQVTLPERHIGGGIWERVAIAHVNAGVDRDWDNAIANTHLMAAAPALLAALERCKGALEVLRPTRNLGAVEQANEAIAKARGES